MFFTVEGIDGAGKSSVVRRVAEILKDHAFDVVVVRAPGGTPTAEKLREIVLNPENNMTAKARFAIFAANMNQLGQEVILPALDQGKIVIADRYADSTRVYQILTNDELSAVDRRVMDEFLSAMSLSPDFTFILDVEPEEGMRRTKLIEKDVQNDVFESAAMQVWEQRRRAFKHLVARGRDESNGPDYQLIDVTRASIEEVSQKIAREIEGLAWMRSRIPDSIAV